VIGGTGRLTGLGELTNKAVTQAVPDTLDSRGLSAMRVLYTPEEPVKSASNMIRPAKLANTFEEPDRLTVRCDSLLHVD
jgi:hypothetical protein